MSVPDSSGTDAAALLFADLERDWVDQPGVPMTVGRAPESSPAAPAGPASGRVPLRLAVFDLADGSPVAGVQAGIAGGPAARTDESGECVLTLPDVALAQHLSLELVRGGPVLHGRLTLGWSAEPGVLGLTPEPTGVPPRPAATCFVGLCR